MLFAHVHLKVSGSANLVDAVFAAQTTNTKVSGSGAHDISHHLVVSASESEKAIEAFLVAGVAIA